MYEAEYKKTLAELKERANQYTLNSYIEELNKMLSSCQQRAKRIPADSSTPTAESDVVRLEKLLEEQNKLLVKKIPEGGGGVPILRTPDQWKEFNQMQQRCAQYESEKGITSEENYYHKFGGP